MVIIALLVLVSALDLPMESNKGQDIIANIKQPLYHMPSFLLGFMLAPFASNNKKISYFWMILLPVTIVLIQKFSNFGYWPVFLVMPFVAVCCLFFRYAGRVVSPILCFFGKISLESYLLKGIVGTWIIWYLPQLYESPLNKGCYLSYFIVCVVGTVLAYLINRLCNRVLNRQTK